jgi:hypothetical protein
MGVDVALFIVAVGACLIAYVVWAKTRRLARAEAIRTYQWPRGLLERLERKHPGMGRKESALVSRGLRQFFIAYLMSGRKYVSMPSQAADDLWHEFILYTRDYQEFCKRAFGGFLHHTPAVVLADGQRTSNAGLRRVWWYACKYENINPRSPTRLPLLFALDSKLNIPNGFRYEADCKKLKRDGIIGGPGVVHCGGDFTSSSFDGSTTGLGDTSNSDGGGSWFSSSDSGGSDSGGGGGDSGGGGCGGGGGD